MSNVGGLLTHGDYALDTDADCLAIVGHRLALAPFICCDPGVTVGGSGYFPTLIALMSSFVGLSSLSSVGPTGEP